MDYVHDKNVTDLDDLRQKLKTLENAGKSAVSAVISSGSAELDRLLPAGGFRSGALVEWLVDGSGCGAGTLAILAARQACQNGGALVVIDRRRQFYPPAATALGIDLGRTFVVQPQNERDEYWALTQTLACSAVAAVWATIERIDARSFRRLQLAAETSGCLGLLLRPAKVQGEPTWSDVQLLVVPRPISSGPSQDTKGGWRLQVQIVRCRGGTSGGVVDLEMDEVTGALRKVSKNDETHSLRLAAQLAHPTAGRRAARA